MQFDAQGRPTGLNPAKIEPWLFDSLRAEVLLRVVDPGGAVALSNDGQALALAADGQAFAARQQSFAFHHHGVVMHGATVPFTHQGQPWFLQFAVSERMVLRMRESIGFDVLRQGMLALCATFVLVFLVTIHCALRQALQPVREASKAARRIAPQSLGERLPASRQPRELRPLVEAFNEALDRLQAGFRRQQEFLSNAAHELKTPLALIRAQVELTDDAALRTRVINDVDAVARQVQQLLLLAEASEPQNYCPQPLEPRSAAREVLDFLERLAAQAGVTLGLQTSPSAQPWQADRGALFTLLKNLLENAIQHSPPDGVVKLRITAQGFAVSDEGSGVSDAELSHLFDRFWRGEQRRQQGAGLGLAICAEIANAHGWTLTAHRLSPGLEMRCVMGGAGPRPPADDRPF
jgi:signal transduction histidine kinase